MKLRLTAMTALAVWMIAPALLAAQDSTTLDTVVVTSGRIEEQLKYVSTNVTVISGETIEKLTAKDLIDVLQQQGFTVYRTNSGLSNVYIRGLSNGSSQLDYESRVIILLNGHRTGNSNPDLIGLNNIERVEIIRGPAAVQYGSSAMGGVINIITKRGVEGLTATVEAGIGSFDYSTEKLSLLAGHNGLDLSLGLTHSTRGDFKVGDGGDTWRHTSYKHNYSGDLDLGFTFWENHRLGFHHNFNRRSGLDSSTEILTSTRYPYRFTDSAKTVNNTTVSYEGSTESKLFSWMADYTHGSNKYTNYTYNDPTQGGASVKYPDAASRFNQNTDMNQFSLQGSLNHERVTLTAGYEYIRYDADNYADTYSYLNPTTVNIAYSYLENNAGFLIGKLHLLDDTLVFSAGGRYDAFKNVSEGRGLEPDKSVTKNNFTPSVGVAWTPVEYLKLRANYAEGFLMPNPNQFNGGGRYYLPNPDVRPEESKTFEVGADLNWNFIDASVTYYHTDYTNKLATITLPTAPDPNFPLRRYQYINYDGAVFQGVELGLGVDLGAAFDQSFKLRPYANLNWIRARNEDKARFVPQDPKAMQDVPKFNGSLGLDFSHPEYHLDFNINAAYVGKSWTLDHSDLSPHYNAYVWHGGFTMVDLSLSKRIWDFNDKGYLTLKAKVNNLTDEYLDYEIDYPQPGRNFYLGLAYTY